MVSVLQNALEECMAVDSGDQHRWNRKLLDELIDRRVTVHVGLSPTQGS